ncbi:acyltransferase family protein [Nocardioides yefusunii]|uniref:Acyltransferase family protein n=1 Tax=Nocardioides yefusunii TaxID=2500546 RepID=A0ABW1QW14_9ACTN|nr:acyltransferase [Nocardioides yefusunii]
MTASEAHQKDVVRPASEAGFVASLTGLRGFAAIAVVLVHISFWTDYKWVGIHGFGPIALFVLAGYLLFRPYGAWILGAAAQPSTRAYAVRRLMRTFPAYLVAMLVWIVIYPPAVPVDARAWFHTLTMTGVFEVLSIPKGMEQVWSLGTELSWYVALPVLAVALHSCLRGKSPAVRLWVTGAVLLATVPATTAFIAWCYEVGKTQEKLWLPGYLMCFTMGAFVALLVEARAAGLARLEGVERLASSRIVLPVLCLAALAVVMSPLSGPLDLSPRTATEDIVRILSCTALAALLVLGAVFTRDGRGVSAPLRWRWLEATGRWSYGIYLWHLPVIIMLESEADLPDGVAGLLVRFAVVIPIAWALGATSYVWVELPAQEYGRRLSRTRGQAQREEGAGDREAGSHAAGRGAR